MSVRALAMIAALLLSAAAQAGELRLSAGSAVEYDSNVFRNDKNEKDDIVFRIVPRAEIHERRDRLQYQAAYLFPYEVGATEGQIRDLNHVARGDFSYTLSERTRFYGNNLFTYVRGFDRVSRFGSDTDGNLTISEQRRRVLRNELRLGAARDFTPRLSGDLNFGHAFFDSNQDNRAKTNAVDAIATLTYALTPRHRVGGGFEATWQHFDEASGRPQSDTFFYTAFGSWSWQVDETTAVSVWGGPTIVDSDENDAIGSVAVSAETPFTVLPSGEVTVFDFDTCGIAPDGSTVSICSGSFLLDPTVPADLAVISVLTDPALNPTATLSLPSGMSGDSGLTVTALGSASITKQWSPTLYSSLSYSRQASTTSGLAGSTVMDEVSLMTTWKPWQRWEFGVRGDWNLRQSVSDVTQSLPVVVISPVDPTRNIATFDVAGGGLTAVTVSDAVDTQRWGVAVRAQRRMSRNLVVTGRVSYNEQDSKGRTTGVFSDFKDFLVIFGVRYDFDPIELW